jgi:signal transduction histidine kinase
MNIEKTRIDPDIRLLSDEKDFSLSKLSDCYKSMAAASKTGFWLFSPDENILWISKEFANIVELPYIDGQPDFNHLGEIIGTESEINFLRAVEQLKLGEPEAEFETSIIDSKKQTRILLSQISFLDIEKEKKIIIGVVTNISKYKKVEEELAKSKEIAEESDKIKSIFLTNLSHEIRTPMNAIIGFTELLNIGEVTGERKREYLSIIKNKSRQLLSLIDDIAELSKFESGEYTINKIETNIAKLLNELHFEYSKELTIQNKQNIEIYLKLPTEYNIATVYTDSGRLQQVMSYLLDNALKYTERGYIQFGYELKDSRHLQFFVKDTGIGIPKEAQKNLFNRFRIKEEVYDKKFRNTGLGLTISRSIVELLGGKIQVDSTPGQGSFFSFTIPLHKVDKAGIFENVKPEELFTNWRNKVILVAEDDEVNYRFIEAVFADTQAQLLHVNDGKQAVELCHTIGKIDLILMDIKMPEKSGYQAVREIKSFRKEIPIIAQTAYTLSDDKAKCIQAGCDDYISKPIDIELLFSKINKYFNQ